MYIVAGFLNILQKQFENINIDISRILEEFGMNPSDLTIPVKKIDANVLGKYLELLVSETGNDRIGLETGFAIPFVITGTVFNLYHKCEKVEQVFNNLDIFDPTLNDITYYSTRIEGDLFYYEIKIDPEFTIKYPVAARQWLEMQYGISLQYAQSFTGRYIHPLRACTAYPYQGEADRLEEYLNCPVSYEQDKLVMVFKKSILDLPVTTANKVLLPMLINFIDEIREIDEGKSFSNSVRRYLLHGISNVDLSLKSVAYHFNMSERSIQRKLKIEDTSYQLILNKLRIELAEKYIRNKVPFVEIAFLLGFETQSAFNKFFRKHFGYSPSRMR